MTGRYLIGLILVLLCGGTAGHADYKELVTAWEAWHPPVYAVSETPEQAAPETEKGNGQGVSGHMAWQSTVAGLLTRGSFLQSAPAPLTGGALDGSAVDGSAVDGSAVDGSAVDGSAVDGGAVTVETAGAALRPVLTLPDLERFGIARNPAILAARAAVEAELDGFGQVADLDAVLSRYTAFTQGLMTGVGPMKGKPDMSQSFPFPGASGIKTRIIAENAAMAALDLHITVRDTVTAVRNAYWNYALVHEKLEILNETLRLFEHLHDIASFMYKTGKTSYQDVIRISIKTKVLANQITTIKENRQVAAAAILALLDLPGETALGRPEDRRVDTAVPAAAVLIGQALETRQEIRRMDHAIAKMELMIEMTESMVLPPLDMGLSENVLADINTAGTWSAKGAFPDQPPSASMGAGQPKRPWFGTAESWLAQTRKKLAALRHKRQSLMARTEASVQSARSRLDDAVRTYRLYKDAILDLSASALDVSTREYESGSISFAETAGAYNNWLNARLALAAAKRDAGVLRADLQQTVGFSF